MTDQVLYFFSKTRKQRSRLYIRMGLFCWVYVIGILLYEEFGDKPVPDDLHLAMVIAFPVASAILFLVAWWHLRNPATYRAMITPERFTIEYPNSESWSFDVNVADIKRFEYRQTHSHAGEGIMNHGILMKDGSFHHISMNFGNHIKEMYEAIKSVSPEVTFSSRVNKRFQGLGLDRDYEK